MEYLGATAGARHGQPDNALRDRRRSTADGMEISRSQELLRDLEREPERVQLHKAALEETEPNAPDLW